MSDSKRRKDRQSTEEDSANAVESEHEAEASSQRSGPLESLFQEVVRRTAALGFSGLFMTEEAVRKALTDSVPQDWVNYFGRQSDEVRNELVARLSQEFGSWLSSVDLGTVLGGLLEEYEFSAKLEVTAHRNTKNPATSLKIIPRRK